MITVSFRKFNIMDFSQPAIVWGDSQIGVLLYFCTLTSMLQRHTYRWVPGEALTAHCLVLPFGSIIIQDPLLATDTLRDF